MKVGALFAMGVVGVNVGNDLTLFCVCGIL